MPKFFVNGSTGDVNLGYEATGTTPKLEWDASAEKLTVTGTAEISTADINGGTIDGATIGGSSAGAVTGTTVTATGLMTAQDGLVVDNDGATVATFDRATSDGTIVDLQKDGSTVGSIGVDGSRVVISADNNAGLALGDNRLYPRNNGNFSDNTVDIGASTYRFKDLYLSGGIYIGGTAAANKLDDYEEGTWTATWTTSSTPPTTPPTATGFYIKTGRLVTASVRIGPGDLSGATGSMIITGLPFTVSNSTTSNPQGSVSFFGISFAANAIQSVPWAVGNTTTVAFYTTIDGGNWAATAVTAGSTKYVELTISYQH